MSEHPPGARGFVEQDFREPPEDTYVPPVDAESQTPFTEDPIDPDQLAPDLQVPGASDGSLEESILPSLVPTTAVIEPGTVVDPDGHLRVREFLRTRGRVNEYAVDEIQPDGETVELELRQGPLDHQGLANEQAILSEVRFAMLPSVHLSLERAGERLLAVRVSGSASLEDALAAGLATEQALSVVLQLTQVVRRIHAAGWAVLAISPADVHMGEPIQLTRLSHAVRIGTSLPGPLHVPGYSAPELANATEITGVEDVYMLGAVLFHLLTGQVLSETGMERDSLSSFVRLPGAPQLLFRALAPINEQIDLETLYRDLLSLRNRMNDALLALEVASATTMGLNPTRLVNEDACGYLLGSKAGADDQPFRALLCVADGMGGMDAGEVASQSAVQSILGSAGQWANPSSATAEDGPESPIDPVELIRDAAPAVHAAAQGRSTGTTATCVVVHRSELRLGHVGDTRAYHFRNGALTQLTNDHSLVAAMVNSGVLTPEEARGHPDSNKVLRSLGGQRELPDSYVDSLEAATGQSVLTLQGGDWLMLCSDGVWGSVPDAAIRTVLAEAMNCHTAARALIDRALQAGAPDNATAIVAHCIKGLGV
jgi:PPM family protein phosphatase